MYTGKTVFLVDDDPIIRMSLEKFLTKEGIKVITAPNFEETVKKLKENPNITLALVDYLLPDVEEGGAVELFLQKKIPTILLTATYDKKIRKLYVEKGLVDYIFKSIPGALQLTIQTVKRVLKNINTKVLIVDDAVTDRTIIKKFLRNSLFKVFTAKSLKEAEEKLKENPDIKLILMDFHLPDEDPLKFVLKVRAKYPKTKLGIIVISGYLDEDMLPIVLKSDVNDVLRKPFYREELINRAYNILDIIEKYAELEELAYKDPLTGLYNRRYFMEHGKKFLGVAKRNKLNVAFVLFDLDKFKSINDTYGHDIGDIVLKDFADKLKAFFRRDEDIVARLGGEEFALLTTYEDFDKFKDYLLKFHKFINENALCLPQLRKELRYTFSAGVATGNDHSLEELYKIADNKLYKAKESGRNRIIF